MLSLLSNVGLVCGAGRRVRRRRPGVRLRQGRRSCGPRLGAIKPQLWQQLGRDPGRDTHIVPRPSSVFLKFCLGLVGSTGPDSMLSSRARRGASLFLIRLRAQKTLAGNLHFSFVSVPPSLRHTPSALPAGAGSTVELGGLCVGRQPPPAAPPAAAPRSSGATTGKSESRVQEKVANYTGPRL